MSRGVRYVHHRPGETRLLIEPLQAIYAAVFSEPPYSEGAEMINKFGQWLTKETTRSGFDLVTATVDEHLVGFTYGYTMRPGDWWRRTDRKPAPELKATQKFAVMEWAVHPEYRRRGIGRQLMGELLSKRAEHWATLAVNPASDARAIYEHWGWEHVATTEAHSMPAMDVMVRALGPLVRESDGA